MIFSAMMGKILVTLAFVGITALFAFLWKKMKKNPVAGGTIGFFVSIVPAIMLAVMSTGLYVVHGEDDCSEYWVYGNPTYTTEGGEEIKIENEMAEYTVINDSDVDIVVECVTYGFGEAIDDEFLGEGDVLKMDRKVSYFWGEIPPDEVELSNGSYSNRLWLRTESDFVDDYY